MSEEPSAVTKRTPEPEVEGGAGKTETEAPEERRKKILEVDERRFRSMGRKGECILLPGS